MYGSPAYGGLISCRQYGVRVGSMEYYYRTAFQINEHVLLLSKTARSAWRHNLQEGPLRYFRPMTTVLHGGLVNKQGLERASLFALTTETPG